MKIGEKIKKLRTEKMMTQSEVTGGVITRNMLSCIENGSAQPSLPTLLHIANKLHVSAGYLLADDEEEKLYMKMEELVNIKNAYLSDNIRICRDMCRKTLLSYDDEVKLIHAECALTLGVEAFDYGRLKDACKYFDESLEAASETIYNTTRIIARICAYLKYIKKISLTLSSEIIDESDYETYPAIDDIFVRYALLIDAIEAGNTSLLEFFGDNIDASSPYSLHISAKIDMLNRDYDEAYTKLYMILTMPEKIQEPIMYFVFCDLEVCCKETKNFKGAYEYSNNKIELLQKMLRD